jgi:hypothetical protein
MYIYVPVEQSSSKDTWIALTANPVAEGLSTHQESSPNPSTGTRRNLLGKVLCHYLCAPGEPAAITGTLHSSQGTSPCSAPPAHACNFHLHLFQMGTEARMYDPAMIRDTRPAARAGKVFIKNFVLLSLFLVRCLHVLLPP